MTTVNFADAVATKTEVSTRRTADGYLVGNVRCARTGTQLYKRRELGLTDGDPESFITVYRPPEAVFAEDSLKTYAGKPVTMGHPKEAVSSENWKDHAIGSVGSTVVRDGDCVRVDFAIMDAAAASAVEAGTRQISMGYRTPLEMRDGVTPDGTPYQAVQVGPIRINHLAVVDEARGGEALTIADGNPQWASPLHQQETFMSGTKLVVLGDSAVNLPFADAAAVEAFKANLTAQLADAVQAKKDSDKEKDEEIGVLKAKNKQLEDAASPEALNARIAARTKLIGDAASIAPALVADSLSDADIRRQAVVATLGDAAVEGSSDAEVAGMFRALVVQKDAAPDDTVREALRSTSRQVADAASGDLWNDSIAAAAGVSFKKGK